MTRLALFLSTLWGMLKSVLIRGTIEYVLMGFNFLLSTISSNNGSSSDSEE